MKNKLIKITGSLILLITSIAIPNLNLFQSEKVSAESESVTVDKDNFLEYFNINGDASYTSDDGLLNLTNDWFSSVGNASLKTKIDFSRPFRLKMKVNLGNKSQANQGADGLGLVFHTSDINSVGSVGNGFGAGGLSDAIGFKLDTNWNMNDEPHLLSRKDPNSPGYDHSFGGFIYTDAGGYVATYQPTTSDPAAVKEIPNPDNNIFRDCEIIYDGNGNMKVTYDGIEWTADVINTFNMSDLVRSFCISASTGYYYNFHQLYFEEFTYTPDRGILIVRHESEDGISLKGEVKTFGNPTLTNETYTTSQETFTNYTFKEMKTGSDNTNGIYEVGKIKTVTYVYKRDTGNLVIRHEDENGKLIEPQFEVTKNTGETYTSSQKIFTGYTFKEIKVGSDSENGIYEKDVTKQVTYIYTRDQGSLIIRHEDEDGNALELPELSTKDTGETYSTSKKDFNGYTFKEMKADSYPENGIYEKDITKTVTYVYKKNAVIPDVPELPQKPDNPEVPETPVTPGVTISGNDKTITYKPSITSMDKSNAIAVNTSDITDTKLYISLLIASIAIISVKIKRNKKA